MQKLDFNENWTFQYGEPSNIPMMPAEKTTVSLPHDFMIAGEVLKDAKSGDGTGYYIGGIGSYTKYIETEDYVDTHILYVDGCFGATKVLVNGHIVKRHHYGYAPFQADLTEYLKPNTKNRITIVANSSNEPNGRWYSGAGLYRKVFLYKGKEQVILPDGIYTKVKKLFAEVAEVEVFVKIQNRGEQEQDLPLQALLKETGEVVYAEEVVVKAKETTVHAFTITIRNPKLWDLEQPNLYHLQVGFQEEWAETSFGLRTVEVDAKEGLRLNGKPLKLKGGCIHHDHGILGAASYATAEYRKVLLHKKNGFNALRFAHNPMSSDLLQACDEIGVLVIDEFFDVWNQNKNDFDFAQYFAYEGVTELEAIMERDRNHPSVFMWSIGNELPEQGGMTQGYETSEMLVKAAKRMDDTRPVGGALCSFFRGLDDQDNEKYWQSIMANMAELQKNGAVNLDCEFGRNVWDPYTTPFVKDWDIVGYNYLKYQFEPSHEKHPERVICTTESKPREFGEYWADTLEKPYIIGDFEWTSMDYLGEAGIAKRYYVEPEEVAQLQMTLHRPSFPDRSAGSGNFDICGFEKPQLAYKKCVWGTEETFLYTQKPEYFGKTEVLGRYAWPQMEHTNTWPASTGDSYRLYVYSTAPLVEVLQNGTSLGKKPCGKNQNFTAVFEANYQPGVCVAISYNAEGKEISRDMVKPAGEKRMLSWSIDETAKQVATNYTDTKEEGLLYVALQITDENALPIFYEDTKLQASVEGADLQLLALGSGRPTTEENYTKGEITTYRGMAMAVVKGKQGVLIVESEELGKIEIEIA